MKLEATCETCGRRFALVQILPETGPGAGRCPFCGRHFGRHYVTLLPRAIREAEAAADSLADSIDRLHGMRPGFQVDLEAFMNSLREALWTDTEDESA